MLGRTLGGGSPSPGPLAMVRSRMWLLCGFTYGASVSCGVRRRVIKICDRNQGLRKFFRTTWTSLRNYLEQLGVSQRTDHCWIETRQLDLDIGEETIGPALYRRCPRKLDTDKGIVLSRLAEKLIEGSCE